MTQGVQQFWKSVCSKLRCADLARFYFDDTTDSLTTVYSLFRLSRSAVPAILLLDEASVLVDKDTEITNSFIHTLRELKGNMLYKKNLGFGTAQFRAESVRLRVPC
jgi:hypothetical protein